MYNRCWWLESVQDVMAADLVYHLTIDVIKHDILLL